MNLITAEPTAAPDDDALADANETAVGNSSLLPDPKTLLIIFFRRFWIFVIVFALILGSAVAYANLAPRKYTSIATALIEPRHGDPVQQTAGAADQAPTSDVIDTQILSFDSPQLSARVVQALGLLDDPQFGGAAPAQAVPLTPAQERERLTTAAGRLRGTVAIRRAGQTALLQIAATTVSPTQSARIANEYVTQYLRTIAEANARAAVQMNQQINGRLDQLRREAEQADAALQAYKIAHGLMSAEGATLAEQESSALNTQVQQQRADLAEKQSRLATARQQLRSGGGGSDVSSVLSSGTIGALRNAEAESSRNLAQLRARYGPRHPSVEQEEKRLADVQSKIQAESDRILSSMQGEVNVASSKLSALQSGEGQARSKLAANAQAQVGFMELQRKDDAARTVYEAFLNKSRGTAARDGIEQPLASRASTAIPATAPSSPNVRLIYLIGLLGALVASTLAVATAEFLDSGIKTKADVERRLGARYLGSIPDLESTLDGLRATEAPPEYIVSHPLSTFAEALRNLRASVTLRGNRRPKVIAVTSALPREGKTTTALCLARTLALSGASTVLVDCDVRRHSASDALLGDREGRLLEVLAGDLPVEQALLRDESTDLQILGTSRAPQGGRDLLASDLVTALLNDLRGRFEYVVIDTAPVLGIADARLVASLADAVLLLARWRHTSLRAADTALDLLIGARAKVYGVALTQVDIRKFGSTGQEDVYGYHKQFKGYYVN